MKEKPAIGLTDYWTEKIPKCEIPWRKEIVEIKRNYTLNKEMSWAHE